MTSKCSGLIVVSSSQFNLNCVIIEIFTQLVDRHRSGRISDIIFLYMYFGIFRLPLLFLVHLLSLTLTLKFGNFETTFLFQLLS